MGAAPGAADYAPPGQETPPGRTEGLPTPATPASPAQPSTGQQPSAKITREQARTLVKLAEGSAQTMQNFLDRAAAATAKARDREAARNLGACVSAIAMDAGPLGQLVKKLREAEAQGIEPQVTLDEAKALEAFALCATAVQEKAQQQAKAEAGVGVGLPLIGIAALLL